MFLITLLSCCLKLSDADVFVQENVPKYSTKVEYTQFTMFQPTATTTAGDETTAGLGSTTSAVIEITSEGTEIIDTTSKGAETGSTGAEIASTEAENASTGAETATAMGDQTTGDETTITAGSATTSGGIPTEKPSGSFYFKYGISQTYSENITTYYRTDEKEVRRDAVKWS